MNLLFSIILGYITLFIIFAIKHKINKKKELLKEEKEREIKEKEIREREIQLQTKTIDLLFEDEFKDPNITIKILEINCDKKYIKLGVNISTVGVADALINGSQIEYMRKKALVYKHFQGIPAELKYDIDIILINNDLEN